MIRNGHLRGIIDFHINFPENVGKNEVEFAPG
jgi:hypothetical protein